MEDRGLKKKVFVTVGTTSFDKLVAVISDPATVLTLEKRGYKHMTIQIGRGQVKPTSPVCSDFTIDHFTYKDSIADDINSADLVISHAGAGSCLEVLSARKPLVVVINEDLMNNHQIELASRLAKDDHLFYCDCKSLQELLRTMDLAQLKPFENGQPDFFVSFLDTVMGVAS